MAKPSGEQIELNALQLQFLADLNRNWAASGALQQLVPTGSVGSHPFWPEVYNLCDGRPASFPFFVKGYNLFGACWPVMKELCSRAFLLFEPG
jgi:hypothetical protein